MRIGVSRTDTRGIKIMNLEIMLINSNEENLYPKWVWCGDLSSHRCVWCGYTWFVNLLLSPVEEYGLFYVIIWYIVFYFELADDTYSVLVFVLTPTYMFLSLLCVECSKRAVVFNSTATLASLHYTGFQGELMLLAWTGSSSLCLDVLKSRHGLDFHLF